MITFFALIFKIPKLPEYEIKPELRPVKYFTICQQFIF